MRSRRGLLIIATQQPVLDTTSENKRKKKAMRKSVKGRKRTSFVKEDKNNVALELAIEEEIENAA